MTGHSEDSSDASRLDMRYPVLSAFRQPMSFTKFSQHGNSEIGQLFGRHECPSSDDVDKLNFLSDVPRHEVGEESLDIRTPEQWNTMRVSKPCGSLHLVVDDMVSVI